MSSLIALLVLSQAHAASAPAQGALKIHAASPSGAPVVASVHFLSGPATVPSAALSREGEGWFDLPAGTWTVLVSDGAHAPVEQELEVHAGQARSLWVHFQNPTR